MKQPIAVLVLGVMAGLPVVPARASSPDAWADHRHAVESACSALVTAPVDGSLAIEVNPFGSERYGVALIAIRQPAGQELLACIFDKGSGKAELTAPFAARAEGD